MPLIDALDSEFLRVRQEVEHVKWHEGVPSVWQPLDGVSLQDIETKMASDHWIIGWSISYNEGHTIINAMRPIEFGISGKLDGHQKQLHARARIVTDSSSMGLQWAVHTEALAVTSPQDHYDHVDLNWSDGQKRFYNYMHGVDDSIEKKDKSWSPKPVS